MKLKKALLVVDVQNDFCSGGALAVPEGDKVVPVLNKYIRIFSGRKLPVFASRDWHPKKTQHFKKYGGLWPVHCVQGTQGAKFHLQLKLPREVIIVSKGMNSLEDSYSVFQAYDANGMTFLSLLRYLGIQELYVGGLATDYCVKSSVLDALRQGFKVKVLTDASRGVNLKPCDSADALKEMLQSGAKTITLKDMAGRTQACKSAINRQ